MLVSSAKSVSLNGMNGKSEGMWDKVLMIYLIESPDICLKEVRKTQ
jgi:hypothetical protein